MNNQEKVANIIFKAIEDGNEQKMREWYPRYQRYMSRVPKEYRNYELLEDINNKWADYFIKKHRSPKEDWFTWTREDANDLENSIKEDLLE